MAFQFAKCKTAVNYQNDSIKLICDVCYGHIHEQCSGLSATEVRCIPLKNRSLLFLCEPCRSNSKDLPRLLQQITEFCTRVADLTREVN